MPVVALLSAKGSPGVTTAAVALAGAACDPESPGAGATVVEVDPSGGDLDVLTGARVGEPSLVAAVTDLRRGVGGQVLAGHGVAAVPWVKALLAPTAASTASRVVAAVTEELCAGLAAVSGWVLVDAGRWGPQQATASRLAGAGVVALVCRSTAPSVAHARDLVGPLRAVSPRLAVLLVGEEPYGRVEVAGVLDVPVLGPLAWDRRGVSALWSRGATPRWRTRSALGRSARRVLDGLGELTDGPQAVDAERVAEG